MPNTSPTPQNGIPCANPTTPGILYKFQVQDEATQQWSDANIAQVFPNLDIAFFISTAENAGPFQIEVRYNSNLDTLKSEDFTTKKLGDNMYSLDTWEFSPSGNLCLEPPVQPVDQNAKLSFILNESTATDYFYVEVYSMTNSGGKPGSRMKKYRWRVPVPIKED